MGDRGPEECEQAVAEKMGDGALVAIDRLRHEIESPVEDSGPHLGIDPLQNAGGSDDVGEQRGYRLALSL
jgi:hypothetical protein